MAARVKLADIVDAIDLPQQDWRSFLNRETGEIVTLTEDGIVPEDEGLDEEALESEPFLPLPDKSELDEWSMMERFAETRSEREREELLEAIQGRGAFRIFKSTIRRLGVEQDWFNYRDAAYEEFAREWLRDNRIEWGK